MFLREQPNVEDLLAKCDITGLIKALGYIKDPKVRWSAAEALGDIGDAHVVEPLLAALMDGDALVRRAAGVALVKLHWLPQ